MRTLRIPMPWPGDAVLYTDSHGVERNAMIFESNSEDSAVGLVASDIGQYTDVLFDPEGRPNTWRYHHENTVLVSLESDERLSARGLLSRAVRVLRRFLYTLGGAQ